MLGEKIGAVLDKLAPYAYLLCLGAGGALLGCISYCTTIWIPMGPPTMIMPDIGLICGIYCATRISAVGYITILTGVVMLISGVLLKLGKDVWGARLAFITGVMSIPVGVFALVAAYLTWQKKNPDPNNC